MCDTGTCTKTSKFWIQSTVIEASAFSCSAHLVKATRELTEMSRKATVSGNAPAGYTFIRRYASRPQNYSYVTVKPV